MKRSPLRWCLLALALEAGNAAAAEFYVAPGGNDHNAGTIDRPWATLAGARDALRAWRAEHIGSDTPITVWVHGGDYPQTGSLEFGPQDSGATAETPIVFAPMPEETARIIGAVRLDPAWFRPVTASSPDWSRIDPSARSHLLVAELKAHGLSDWGEIHPRGFSLRAPAPAELFWNGQPMTLARWPNVGEPFARTGRVLTATRFKYSGNRPARWTREPAVWLHGFWNEDWADFQVSVRTIDSAAQTVTLTAPPAQYGLAADRPYVAYNLLCELDQPGEYYLDRASGRLYFWPPVPLDGANLELSRLEQPLLTVTGAQFIIFRDLVWEATRGPLAVVTGATAVRFEACRFRGAGQFAVSIAGSDSGLDHCEITDCGEEGVRLGGGDRATLAAGRNFVTNSSLRRTGSSNWTYKPAISFEGGCGNLAAHNLIEDLPHAAILFSGNNHLISANEIRQVCRLTGDSGAIYAGRNWGFRGNRIEFNYLHDIASTLGHADVNGVYLDDCLSGVTVFGNVFAAISGTAIFCGGGRDNVMTNNLIVDCGTAHYDDDRGRKQITAKPGDAWNLLESLNAEAVKYQRQPWAQAYPECAAIPNSPALINQGLWRNPEHSVFSRNAGWGNRHWLKEENDSKTGVFAVYVPMTGNRSDLKPLFDRGGARPEQLVADVPGFVPIPFAAIGPERPHTQAGGGP